MKTWDSTNAKQHFSAVLNSSMVEPQIVERRGKPVSVIISYDNFLKSKIVNEKQSITGWLNELNNINGTEEDMPDVLRADRSQPDWD